MGKTTSDEQREKVAKMSREQIEKESDKMINNFFDSHPREREFVLKEFDDNKYNGNSEERATCLYFIAAFYMGREEGMAHYEIVNACQELLMDTKRNLNTFKEVFGF